MTEEPKPQPPKQRILLVDDEPAIIQMIGKRLELAGFEVLTAADGEEALSKVEQQPDAIILDLMLPKRSGLEVCSAIRKEERYNHIPIILFTGKGGDDVLTSIGTDKDRLRQWGADGYVQKTDGANAVILKVMEVLAKPRTTS